MNGLAMLVVLVIWPQHAHLCPQLGPSWLLTTTPPIVHLNEKALVSAVDIIFLEIHNGVF